MRSPVELIFDWVAEHVTEIEELKAPAGRVRLQMTAVFDNGMVIIARTRRTAPAALAACVMAGMKQQQKAVWP